MLRDNASLLAQACGVEQPSPYGPPEPTGELDALAARRDLLLSQDTLNSRQANELARIVQVLTRAEDGRRRPIQHGASGYRRGCKCTVCLEGHAERHRAQRQKRLGDDVQAAVERPHVDAGRVG
jgi:hypothetical protein